jgi:hypothetical protein
MNRKPNAVAGLRAVAVSRRRLLGGAAVLAGGVAVTPWAGEALAPSRQLGYG